MQKVRLGRTGLVVPRNGFGALPIQRISQDAAVRLIRRALDGGMYYFDTARFYTDSEEKLGVALEGRRSEVIISTKTGATKVEDFWNQLETSLRLFPDRWRLGAPSNHTHLALSRQSFEPLRIQRLGQEQHYLGPLNGPELLVVLPEAKAVGSVAMSMLGSDADLGVVLFTSRDASHYQQGQGTQLLHEIALMLPELLERWIERV